MKIMPLLNNYSSQGTNFKARFKSDDPVLQMYYDDIEKYKPLTKPEKRKINAQINAGGKVAEEATEKLVLSNLGRVVKVAKTYAGNGVSLGDLIQAGNLALIDAAEEFNADNDRFWSNIVQRIHSAIRNELMNNNHTARIPENSQTELKKIKEITEMFMDKYGRKPTLQELGSRLEKKHTHGIKELMYALTENAGSREELHRQKEDSNNYPDALKDEKHDAGTLLDRKNLRKTLRALIKDNLTEREADAVDLYFGVDPKNKYDLRESYLSYREKYRLPYFRYIFDVQDAVSKLRRKSVLLEEYLHDMQSRENYNFADRCRRFYY